jgi:hypothetical protein
MDKTNQHVDEDIKKDKLKMQKPVDNKHLGSSNAFEETENPLSRDADNISDEKLDELLDG